MRTSKLGSGAILAVSLALAASMALAQASRKGCDVESFKQDAAKNTGLLSALTGSFSSSRCSSLQNILRQITNGTIIAGRQLEQSRPFDPVAAQQELTAARANPEIQAAVAFELEGVTDPNRQLLLEAVVMHDKRRLLARDLLLQQLGSGSKP